MDNLIKEFLKCNRERKLTIRCIGDALIDEYFNVDVTRVSPEAPLCIMRSYNTEAKRRPGGVANVAHQLKHFNVERQLVCFSDPVLDEVLFEHLLMGFDKNTSFDIAPDGGFIPRKRRYSHDGTQVCRHDIEDKCYGLKDIKSAQNSLLTLMSKYDPQTENPDVVILSDYDKGIFTNTDIDWISYFRDKITIVDPKSNPIKRWKGCTIFKPNKNEAALLSGTTNWGEQCEYFHNELGCKGVFITHGGDKVVGSWDKHLFCYTPEKKVNVASVIGAGDCFMAGLAMAIGHGFEGRDAAEIAYRAGEVYVQQKLNRPIVPAEMSPDGIVDPLDLVKRDFKLVFANGCFDILHAGHLQMLEFAKSKGDKLVVAVNTDESIRKYKGPTRPKNCLKMRMDVLAALKVVDFVTCFEETDPVEIIKRMQPDVQIKGRDWEGKPMPETGLVPEVYFAPLIDGVSTTKLLSG